MQCPTCKKQVAESGDQRPPSFPFCSERCRLIDLGRWLDGKYQIPLADGADQRANKTTADTNTHD